MRKLLCVLLCFALAPGCSAACAKTASDYAGSWSLIEVVSDGRSKTATEAGIPDQTIAVEADGTSRTHSVMDGTDETGTWQAAEGGISLIAADGETAFFASDEAGHLVKEEDGVRLVFSRFSTYCGT